MMALKQSINLEKDRYEKIHFEDLHYNSVYWDDTLYKYGFRE